MRAGSGILFVALGAAVLAVGRKRPGNVAFGAWCVLFGTPFVAFNLAVYDPQLSAAALWVTAASVAGQVVATGVLYVTFPGARVPLPALAAGAATAAVVTPLLVLSIATLDPGLNPLGLPPSAMLPFRVLSFVTSAGTGMVFGYLVVLALRARATDDVAAHRRYAVLACGVALYFVHLAGRELLPGGYFGPWSSLGHGIGLAVAATAWLVAATRAGRPATVVSLVLLGTAATTMTAASLAGGAYALELTPFLGVLRAGMVALLAWAVLRHGLLGFDLAVPAARRGSLATVALVAFFVVAQIAQEFLSDSMGVILGGVAAGALLFAAAPLQRAAERAVQREVPVRRATTTAEAGFKAAVRAAMRDGRVTRREERHLAEVADALGLAPSDVVRLRDEVEAEAEEAR